MKILCAVCSKDEASVFCCADEAALCNACDRTVHLANKLAGQHDRLSLTSQSQPTCDVCQEKRGFVFCQQDRAILCHHCDSSIHTANQLTMKHNRFLLTGIRLSATPIPEPLQVDKVSSNKAVVSNSFHDSGSNSSNNSSNNSNNNSSSISEYLIKTIPGYRVEDLLIDNNFYKNNQVMPFLESDLQPNIKDPGLIYSTAEADGGISYHHGFMEKDDCFMVPQITVPTSSNKKRSRPSSFWYL